MTETRARVYRRQPKLTANEYFQNEKHLAEFDEKAVPGVMQRDREFGHDHVLIYFRLKGASSAVVPAHLAAYTRAAPAKTVLAHLNRLATHKVLRDAGVDGAIFLAEVAKRLADGGATELEVFEAVEFFLEQDEGDFFPNFARLSKKVFGRPLKEEKQGRLKFGEAREGGKD